MPRSVGYAMASALRRDRVPEADVDLEIDPGLPEPRLQLHALAAIFLFLADRLDGHRVGGEHQPVVRGLQLAERPEDLGETLPAALAEPEQIEVPRRAVELARPEREEQGAFEHEPRGMLRRDSRSRSRSTA